MRRTVTNCVAICVILTSAGRSAANVSIPFPDSRAVVEVVDDQSWVFDAQSGRVALASPQQGSRTWPGPYPFFSDIVIHAAVPDAATVMGDALGVPSEPASPAVAGKGMMALPHAEGALWPAISTRLVGYLGSAKALPQSTFSDLYTSTIVYAHVDLTDLGETSALEGLAFEPYLPSGAIVLGGVAVGLIGWLWRRRIFSYEKYP